MSADLISRPKLKSFVHATVDKHSLPGDVRGTLRSQPNNGLGHFAWFAQALEWRVCGPAIKNLLFIFSQCRRPCLGQLF